MIIAAYNVNKGLINKMGLISNMIKNENIDVLCMLETDLVGCIPQIPGFKAIFDTNMEIKRIIMYVKAGIKCQQVIIEDDEMIPTITINLSTMTITGCYNQFTNRAYANDSQRMTKKIMLENFLYTMRKIDSNKAQPLKRRRVVVGDVNFNWKRNELDIQSRVESMNYIQLIDQPTRGSSILDHIYVRNLSEAQYQTKVFNYGISDHAGVAIKIGKTKAAKRNVQYIDIEKIKRERNEWTLADRAFINLDQDVLEMLEELRNQQEYYTTKKTVRIAGPPLWLKDSRIKELAQKMKNLEHNEQKEEWMKIKKQY